MKFFPLCNSLLRILTLCAGVSGLLVGCGGDARRSEKDSQLHGKNVFRGSPQEVFETAYTAAQAHDWKRFWDCLTETSRDDWAAGMVVTASQVREGIRSLKESLKGALKGEEKLVEYMARVKFLDDALTKHGITEVALQELKIEGNQIELLQNAEKLRTVMRPVINSIEDRGALLADLFTAMHQFRNDPGAPDISPFPRGSSLTEVAINGDTATGFVTGNIGGEFRRRPLGFERGGSDWKIVLPLDYGKKK